MRPPQPNFGGWSGREVCQWVTWSLWENNCGGLGTDLFWYCARVMGCTSGPALNSNAAFCSPNRVASS